MCVDLDDGIIDIKSGQDIYIEEGTGEESIFA
jgi:hypothetical protein